MLPTPLGFALFPWGQQVPSYFDGDWQALYRGRNDDGNEVTATWKESANTPWTQATDENFRVRFSVNRYTGAATQLITRLFYSLNGGVWTAVNGASNVVRSSASVNVADSTPTTAQLGGIGTFFVGEVDTGNGRSFAIAPYMDAGDHTEYEFCIQARSADVSSGDEIALRLDDDSSVALDGYAAIAQLVVA